MFSDRYLQLIFIPIGFLPSVVSTLEVRFGFNSAAVGALLVSFDVSVVIYVVFICYFGEKQHKPRWLAFGVFMQGIGSFIFALPQVFGRYTPGSAEDAVTLESCNTTDGEIFTVTCDSSDYLAYFVMLVGNVFIGFGAAPIFTLGISYIDDITLPEYVPIHVGLFNVCASVGPAIGFGLGGVFLSIYVYPFEETSLTPYSPSWVGAWWLCFIFTGVLSLILAIPFMMYPRLLSNYAEVVAARSKQHATSYTSKLEHEDSFKNQVKAFPRHMWELVKNKSYVFVTLGLSILFLSLYGAVAFGPKYVESVFDLPASIASIYIGALGKLINHRRNFVNTLVLSSTVIIGGSLGIIVGSLIAYFLKSRIKKMALIQWISTILIIPLLFGFFIKCPNLPIANINQYTNR